MKVRGVVGLSLVLVMAFAIQQVASADSSNAKLAPAQATKPGGDESKKQLSTASIQAGADSFGWLALKNFTYCMGDTPDPITKPFGLQPKLTSPNSGGLFGHSTNRLTGMGDSVVVLYHPENRNKAIAWCNTLVAFHNTQHVQCHRALPTCQRCEAIRVGQDGQKGVSAANKEPETDPADNKAKAKPKMRKRQIKPAPATSATGTTTTTTATTTTTKPSEDEGLSQALIEFQDFCENKLTLAVRADCPFHVVNDWSDEPPFDLHRFCMVADASDGYTLDPKLKGKTHQGAFDPNDPIVAPSPDHDATGAKPAPNTQAHTTTPGAEEDKTKVPATST